MAVQPDYYYRVRWGHVDEWLELFERNHYPILREQMASGRLLDFRCYVPRFHGDGRADLVNAGQASQIVHAATRL